MVEQKSPGPGSLEKPRPHLCVLPSVPVWIDGDALILDLKFRDGMREYANLWPGDVSCLMSVSDQPLPRFGFIRFDRSQEPFDCRAISPSHGLSAGDLQGADMVLASGDDARQFGLPALCRAVGSKLVYIIEYTVGTRLKIATLDTPDYLRRVWRWLRILETETLRRRAFGQADALQANGVPAAKAYRRRPVHLFLDTRVGRGEYITAPELGTRLQGMLAQPRRPLRLVFSGRLEAMKGAQYLVPLAQALSRRQVDFELHVFGAGRLEPVIKAAADAELPSGKVFAHGSVDFHAELLPWLKGQADLAILPHVQGDPSCTYLETMACGVPILGFGNEAWLGLLGLADVGWQSPIGDVDGLATTVARLAEDRQALADMAGRALAFASQHDFETVFKGRIDHLRGVLDE